MRIKKVIVVIAMMMVSLTGCSDQPRAKFKESPKDQTLVHKERILSQKDIPYYTYQIAKRYPHDRTAYTEGLIMDDGYLYESTGLYKKSRLVKVDYESGDILKEIKLDSKYFGEGVTILNDEIYQVTYLSNTGFVYDKNNLQLKREFHYPWQGWGLTTDGKRLIMSNGSAALLFLNSQTLEMEKCIMARDNIGYIEFLNELEYVNGYIYANVWQTDFIAKISPDSGKVIAWIDLTGLNPNPKHIRYHDTLNGIAYNDKTDHLIVTGKYWPEIYEIELVSGEE